MDTLKRLSDMTMHERDDFLVAQAARVCRYVGVDMPDAVVQGFFLESEKTQGYQLELLDSVFNCLAYVLRVGIIDGDTQQAFWEMLVLDTDEHKAMAIVRELVEIGRKVAGGYVPARTKPTLN